MARRVYFAFHYQDDIWRVNQVRNSWLTHPDREVAGFYDASLWERAKRSGDDAIKRMINEGLKGTSVTAFLLGAQTANRKWVRYELQRSHELGKGLLAVRIHRLENQLGMVSHVGENIFAKFHITESNGTKKYLNSIWPLYDWVADKGYQNFGKWVAAAAQQAGL